MTHSIPALVRTFVSILVLIALSAAPAAAQWAAEPQGFAKVGGYAGFAGTLDFTLDGETFDGLTFYQEIDGDEIFILPRLDKKPLFKGILGFRGRQGAIEVSYERANFPGTFADEPVDSVFQSVNIDGRLFLLTNTRFQPHILVGGAFPWLRVKEGSALNEDIGDARFRGYGINSEAGVTLYPHPQFGIGVGYSYRWLWFDRASGASDRLGDLRPRFRETAKGVVVTGLVTF
jgi:hypothetical protein